MEQTFGVFGISIKFQKLKSLWNQAESAQRKSLLKTKCLSHFDF